MGARGRGGGGRRGEDEAGKHGGLEISTYGRYGLRKQHKLSRKCFRFEETKKTIKKRFHKYNKILYCYS